MFLTAATRDSSNLLAHEAAFALGQMQDAEAIPALIAVLNDFSLHPIVRHEVGLYHVKIYLYSSHSHNMLIRLNAIVQAAEALGAIGLESNIPLLKNSLALDPAQEVKETCELALNRIEQLKDASCQSMDEKSPFMSVDPAAPATSGSSVNQLRCVWL